MAGFSREVHKQLDDRSGGRCEICGLHDVTEHHHRRPRGAGSSKRPETNQAGNGLAVCGDCHRMVERHRNIAMLCGWLVSQYEEEPASVAVMYRGDLCKLDDDGGKACA